MEIPLADLVHEGPRGELQRLAQTLDKHERQLTNLQQTAHMVAPLLEQNRNATTCTQRVKTGWAVSTPSGVYTSIESLTIPPPPWAKSAVMIASVIARAKQQPAAMSAMEWFLQLVVPGEQPLARFQMGKMGWWYASLTHSVALGGLPFMVPVAAQVSGQGGIADPQARLSLSVTLMWSGLELNSAEAVSP